MISQKFRWFVVVLALSLAVTVACSTETSEPTETAETSVPARATIVSPQGQQVATIPIVATTTPWSVAVMTRVSTLVATSSVLTTPIVTSSVLTTPVVTICTPTTTPMQTSEIITHVVRRGDNLFRIAKKYGVSVQTLAALNGIQNPHSIWVGQKLVVSGLPTAMPIPTAEVITHVVRRGDNLFRIARKYGVSVENLAAWNGIQNPHSIWVGQKLVVSVLPTRTPTLASAPLPIPTDTPTPTDEPTTVDSLSREEISHTRQATPMPTSTDTPTLTEKPTVVEPLSEKEISYARRASAIGLDYSHNSETLVSLMNDASPDRSLLMDDNWKLQIAVTLGALKLDGKSLQNLKAPQRFQDVHQDLLEASRLIDQAVSLVPEKSDKLRPDKTQEIVVAIGPGREAVDQATRKLEKLKERLK